MSDPVVKGVKRSPARPASRHTTSSPTKARTASKSGRPKPLIKRSAAADKVPARKATKSTASASSKSKAAKKSLKSTPASKSKATKSAASSRSKTAVATSRRPAAAKSTKKSARPATKPSAAPSKATKKQATHKHTLKAAPAPAAQRQPTVDEAAALRAFERAHKEFVRGRFNDARMLFRQLVEKHAGVSEVTARARTYLAIAESRLKTESSLPRDADSLYDRGVIELNRGEFVAAQEMFERALKREPDAAHVHYGLAATRARLGSIELALESLQKALDLQPTLRIRAQHDQDLTVLRNDPDFERLVFAPRA
jgi:tetratricopeptide (TPR) repeat protein